MEHKDTLHAAHRLKIAIRYRNKKHLLLTDKWSKQAKVGFERFCGLLECDIT
jgi:hypothetical protein